jgi:hypothetical protein
MNRLFRFVSGAFFSGAFIISLAGCLKFDITNPELPILPPGGKHVLFIGNSLTYTNDLPGTVADLASASGDTVRVLSIALPNFAVIDHALGMSNAVGVIQSQPWDYVVIQQGPTTTQLNRDTLIIAAKILDPYVKAAGGRVASMMAWPNADESHLFDAVRRSSFLAAQAVNGVFMPAGEAWRAALLEDSTIPLYGGDGYHPGPIGTYLAALVIYEKVTGKDARLLPGQAVVAGVTMTMPEERVRFLQRIAHETVARF